jgi:aryl-alcohol dehydrogenase-like predicted oxidoreductase
LFSAWGDSDERQARRMVDICIEAGVTLFDTADVYSNGVAEERLGSAIKGRRDQVMISTKTGLPLGDGPNDAGAARTRLVSAVEASLRRLGTDHLDLLQLHAFDSATRIEDVLRTLEELIRTGKVGQIGVSNFAGWQLMKSLATADRYGLPRYAAHQVYYSLAGRDYEWELMPLGRAEQVGALVWSPLAWGRLTGKLRRENPTPSEGRLRETAKWGPPVDDLRVYRIVDALDEVAAETDRTIPQVALAWLLTRPTVTSVILGARTEAQLRDNLGAIGWTLSSQHIALLDSASTVIPAYPYYPSRTQEGFARLDPPLV